MNQHDFLMYDVNNALSISNITDYLISLCNNKNYFDPIESIALREKLKQLKKLWQCFGYENDPEIAAMSGNIGNILKETSFSALALPFFMEQLRIERLYLGRHHPDLATVLCSIGQIYKSIDELVIAKKYFTDAFNILNTHKRKGKLYALVSYNMGLVNYHLSFYGDSMKYFNLAIKEHIAAYENFHPSVAQILISIGKFQLEIGMLQDAMNNFLEALMISRMTFGNNHSKVAECLYGIGLIHEAKSEFDASLNALFQALSIEENCENRDNRFSQLMLNRICIICQSMEDNDEAINVNANLKKIVDSKTMEDDTFLDIFRIDLDSPPAAAAA